MKEVLHNISMTPCHGIYYIINFLLSSLENDDMESSKRSVKLPSFIFILKVPITPKFVLARN